MLAPTETVAGTRFKEGRRSFNQRKPAIQINHLGEHPNLGNAAFVANGRTKGFGSLAGVTVLATRYRNVLIEVTYLGTHPFHKPKPAPLPATKTTEAATQITRQTIKSLTTCKTC
ncbi:hypothetical protein ACFQHO_28115 [Actinomadura yumaensis]